MPLRPIPPDGSKSCLIRSIPFRPLPLSIPLPVPMPLGPLAVDAGEEVEIDNRSRTLDCHLMFM